MQKNEQHLNNTSTQNSSSFNGFDNFTSNLKFSLSEFLTNFTSKTKSLYSSANNAIDDEFAIPVSQDQINGALYRFVTRNVKYIHELRVELHDGWFRLFCTFEYSGIFAEVAANFKLVHVQMDRNVQRFVFAQQTNTDVLKLRCDTVFKRAGIKLFIWFYHKVLKKDPLGMILHKIKIVKPKDNIHYLSIHRWLKRNKKIMSTLHKAQVNYGIVEAEQLVLKTQVNVRDLFSNPVDADIITKEDAPKATVSNLTAANNSGNSAYYNKNNPSSVADNDSVKTANQNTQHNSINQNSANLA